jgi:pSer/pThr/pTyr-binding forkhead associated (FHA) protein
MSPFALSLMKFGLLVLLYLFVWRALRAAGSGVSGRATEGAAAPRRGAAAPRSSRRRPASGQPTNVVVLSKGGRRIGSHQLSGEIEIGRADHCTIRLSDDYASQVHARLSARNGAWMVEDLGSTNGTYLNERRLESPNEVRAGDRVRIGTKVLELRP